MGHNRGAFFTTTGPINTGHIEGGMTGSPNRTNFYDRIMELIRGYTSDNRQ